MSEEIENNAHSDDNLIVCPCCHQKTLHKPVKPNAQVTDQWMACLITGVPFNHTYPIYGGRINVTVTRLSPELVDMEVKVGAALDKLSAIEWSAGAPVNFDIMKTMYKLCIGITSISMKSTVGNRECHPSQTVCDAYEFLNKAARTLVLNQQDEEGLTALKEAYRLLTSPDTVSSVPLDMLIAVVDAHARISVLLMDAGFDDTFWAGIELA